MELFRCLIGSQNYGLDTPESDRDYYVYHAPSFEQLCYKKDVAREEKFEHGILFHKDIRGLDNMIKKSSFNQIEILWTTDYKVENMHIYSPSQAFSLGRLWGWLRHNRDDIAIANLPRLYQSTLGEFTRRIADINRNKYTEGTKYLFEQQGYDSKNAMHAFRLAYMLIEIGQGNTFNNVVTCDTQTKDWLLGIKTGKYDKQEILNQLNGIRQQILASFFKFDSHKMNEALLVELESLILDVVKAFAV